MFTFLVDDNPTLKGMNFFGYPVIGRKAELLSLTDAPRKGIVAIGSNSARVKVASWLLEKGFERVSTVHPFAQVGRSVKIGKGTVVMAGACINPDTVIGEDVIINTRVSVDHDCVIGDGVHLGPGSTLCGSVTVGAKSFVGAGATVIPNLFIGENVVVGAGSTVVCDVPNNVTVVGSPARSKI